MGACSLFFISMFQIPEEADKLRKELVKQFKDQVVAIRCGNCGRDCMMNAAYTKHVTELQNCRHCR